MSNQRSFDFDCFTHISLALSQPVSPVRGSLGSDQHCVWHLGANPGSGRVQYVSFSHTFPQDSLVFAVFIFATWLRLFLLPWITLGAVMQKNCTLARWRQLEALWSVIQNIQHNVWVGSTAVFSFESPAQTNYFRSSLDDIIILLWSNMSPKWVRSFQVDKLQFHISLDLCVQQDWFRFFFMFSYRNLFKFWNSKWFMH